MPTHSKTPEVSPVRTILRYFDRGHAVLLVAGLVLSAVGWVVRTFDRAYVRHSQAQHLDAPQRK